MGKGKSTSGNKNIRALLGVLLIGLIIIGDIIASIISSPLLPGQTPSSCPTINSSPCLTLVQRGTVSVTFTNTTSLVQGTVSFSPSYGTAPWVGITTHALGGIQQFTQLPIGTSTFFAVESAGITWVNMPSATTEIFGDTGQHWIRIDTHATGLMMTCVTVATSSLSANAVLRPQYSLDNGATWTDINPVGNLDASVSSIGVNCSFGNKPSSLATGFQNKYGVLVRLVGINGADIGDNPVFTTAYLVLFENLRIVFNCGLSSALVSSTSFSWDCRLVLPTLLVVGSKTISFDWISGVQG